MITLTATEESRQDVQELAAFFEGLSYPTIEMQQGVGDIVRRMFGEHFDAEGSPASGPWTNLADWTKEEREFLGFSRAHPILQRTGSYRRSFTIFPSLDSFQELMTQPSGWTLELGSTDWRVDELEGGREGPLDMDPRPVTLMSQGEESRIGDVLDNLFEQAARDMELTHG